MISKSTQTKQEIADLHPDNRYQTPVSLAVAAMQKVRKTIPLDHDIMIDLGCGDLPVWAIAARKAGFQEPIAGVDVRAVNPPGDWYDFYVYPETSFDKAPIACKAPLVFGNPPFSEVRNIVMYYHETYSFGWLYLLLKLEFMSPKTTGYAKRDDIWKEIKPGHIFPIGKRPGWWYYTPEMGFSRKTNSTDYAMYSWNLSRRPYHSYIHPMDWEIDEDLENLVKGMVAK